MAGGWPIKYSKVDNLDLDVENVRIPGQQADQPSVLKYLVEAEDVLSLVENMLRDGYIDIEPIVVVRENGRYVVLEGNRRTSALKCILDSSRAGKHHRQVDRLLSRYSEHDVPDRIRVMVAPTRDEAQPLLARLHTGQPKRPWALEQQAVFYHSQLDDKTTVDHLKTRFPALGSRVARLIRMGEVRELLRNMTYRDKDLETWVKSGKLSMSTLEYAYKTPRVLAALRLAFDAEGRLESTTLNAGQRRALEYLLTLFKDGQLDTRSTEFKKKAADPGPHDRLVEALKAKVAGRKPPADDGTGTSGQDGSGNDHDDDQNDQDDADDHDDDHDNQDVDTGEGGSDGGAGGGSGGAGSGSGSGGNGRGPNRGDTKGRLDPGGFRYAGASPGMRRRYEELLAINVRSSPNAAYDLLRTILECAIKDYLRVKGTRLDPGTTLGGYLDALLADVKGDRRLTGLVNRVKARRQTGRTISGTAEGLNFGNHEPDFYVDHQDVHDAWERLLPVLREVEVRRASLTAGAAAGK